MALFIVILQLRKKASRRRIFDSKRCRLCHQTYRKVMLKYNYSHLTPFDTHIHFVRYERSYRTIRALTPNDTRQQSSLFEITFNVF